MVRREFYIPHKPVVREIAESTKLRIVYDASARAHDNAPSLNDCLHAGSPLTKSTMGSTGARTISPGAA